MHVLEFERVEASAGRHRRALVQVTVETGERLFHRPAGPAAAGQPHAIAAYRDSLRLLISYAATTTGAQPVDLDIADLDTVLVMTFLTHLQTVRGNSTATRNARLAAIRSLFRYAVLHAPEDAAVIQRVLTIPPRRCDRTVVDYLTTAEADLLLVTLPRHLARTP
ncbi:MAG TPA: site-specific integrase [Kineosporiaceae bacterium]